MALPIIGFLSGLTFAQIIKTITIAIIVRVIVSLGITIVVYKGLDIGLTTLQDYVTNQLTAFGAVMPSALAIIQKMGLVDYINILFSAIAGVIAVKAISGAIRKIAIQPSN